MSNIFGITLTTPWLIVQRQQRLEISFGSFQVKLFNLKTSKTYYVNLNKEPVAISTDFPANNFPDCRRLQNKWLVRPKDNEL
jgi:hypothetical protein